MFTSDENLNPIPIHDGIENGTGMGWDGTGMGLGWDWDEMGWD